MLPLGEVFYTRRVAFIAIGIIIAVILPLMLCIICGVYRYRQKQLKEDPQWQMTVPRSRASSRTNLRGVGTGLDYDSDTDNTGTLKKSRSYDKVYRTNEPLPGKPRIDFPAKKWDLDDEDVTSSEGSENKDTKLAKDIEYINKTGEKPKQMGRRSLRAASGTELDKIGAGVGAADGTPIDGHDEHEHDQPDEHDGVGNVHPAGYHQPPSPEVEDHDIHGLPLNAHNQPQQQYSPTFSGVDSRNSGASSMSYQPNAATQNRYGGVPVLPNANSQFFSRPPSMMPQRPAPLIGTPSMQDNGLPSPPHAVSPTPSQQRSTEV